MAFNLENMTIDYKKLLRMVPTQRTDLATSGLINQTLSALTPSQLASLFPRYYREGLPDVGQINRRKDPLSRVLSGAGGYSGTGGGTAQPSITPPSTTKPPEVTPERLAVENILRRNNIAPKKGIANAGQLSKILPGINNDPDLVAAINEQATKFGVTPASIAMILKVENPQLKAGISGGASNKYHGLFQIGRNELGSLGYTPEQYKNMSPAEQTRVWGQWLESVNFIGRSNIVSGDTNQNFAMLMANQLGSGRNLKNKDTNFVLASGQAVSIGGNAVTFNTLNEYANSVNPENIVGIESQVSPEETATLILSDEQRSQLDPKLITYFDKKTTTPEDKANFLEAIKQSGVEGLNKEFATVPVNSQTIETASVKNKELEQKVTIDDAVVLGEKPFIEGNDFAVPIFTNAKNGKKFDENLEKLTPQAIERLKAEAIAAKSAKLTKLELYGAQTHVGHASHGAGTEVDTVGYNPDGSIWTREQRATTALGPVKLAGANRAGLYGSGIGLHIGMADEISDGPKAAGAWGPGGKTSNVPLSAFSPGLERDLAAYLKGRGPMPVSPALEEHLQRMEKRKKELAIESAADEIKPIDSTTTPTGPDTSNIGNIAPGAVPAGAVPENTATPSIESTTGVAPNTNLPDRHQESGVAPKTVVSLTQPPASNLADIAQSNTVPAMATGGLKNVPPGEDILGVNLTTGKPEFYANSREKIRIDPATLESRQPERQSEVEQTQNQQMDRMETQTRSVANQPAPREIHDPYMLEKVASGYIPTTPSFIRATNRARLYNETSGHIVNGRFT